MNDYTRKGSLDGRVARLPTVVIRPGRPNAAASSWVSSIFRERLNGQECTLPVALGTCVPIAGYRTVVDNLVRLHEVDHDALGLDRALNLPALELTAQQMIDGLSAAVPASLGPVHSTQILPSRQSSLLGRSTHRRTARVELGLQRDRGLAEIVASYLEDFGKPGTTDRRRCFGAPRAPWHRDEGNDAAG